AFDAAVVRARTLGLTYRTRAELLDHAAPGPLLNHLAALAASGLAHDQGMASAALGLVDPPDLLFADLVDAYQAHVRTSLATKAPDQLRVWRAQRDRAVINFVQVVGDKAVRRTTRADALAFRDWWLDRIEADSLTADSANKNIGQLNTMANTMADLYRWPDWHRPFSRLRIKGKDRVRPPFSFAWVRERILEPGALAGLNDEAAAVVRIMACTGLRPDEIVNLRHANLRLDASVPHVRVEPQGRQTKTDDAIREVPLLGVALTSARSHLDGFPRYRCSATHASNAINKFMRENGLQEAPETTLYSLRHTFQDLLIEADVPERVQAELMGHAIARERYGKGPTLERKRFWLERALVPFFS
ncbi:MAG: tyrosine-type recombinase/integrase, partial [Pseudomonadota bacterium]